MSKLESTEATTSFGTLSRGDEQDDEAQDEDEDDQDGGVWFYVNKSGFPMNNFTYNRMWDHVAKLHPDSYSVVHRIRGKSLPEVSYMY